MDTTFRGWSATVAARVRLVIARLVLIFALPLDFHGRVRVVRSMYLPAALYGIEASLLASHSLRNLRSSIHTVVWSRRAFCMVWFRFRLLRWYLALWPLEVSRVYRLLEMVSEGSPGHAPIHLLSVSVWLWVGLGLVSPCLVIWLDLFSILRLCFGVLWLVVFGMFFFLAGLGRSPFHVGSVVLLTVPFLGGMHLCSPDS